MIVTLQITFLFFVVFDLFSWRHSRRDSIAIDVLALIFRFVKCLKLWIKAHSIVGRDRSTAKLALCFRVGIIASPFLRLFHEVGRKLYLLRLRHPVYACRLSLSSVSLL